MNTRIKQILGKNLSNINILLVDDERWFLDCLRVSILRPMGFGNIDMVLDVDAALIQLMSKRYDLVITDFAMPGGKNGVELIQIIQKKDPNQHCLILTKDKTLAVIKEMFFGNELVYLVSKDEMEGENSSSFTTTVELVTTYIAMMKMPEIRYLLERKD